jgi:pimeloyl-ACP methyl ester carboxylesterase
MTAERWAFLGKNYASDARPALERTHCPVLAIFGELDLNVPPRESAEMYRKALEAAGNGDVTIRLLPGADHTIHVGKDYAPAYIPTMTGWLDRRFRVGP